MFSFFPLVAIVGLFYIKSHADYRNSMPPSGGCGQMSEAVDGSAQTSNTQSGTGEGSMHVDGSCHCGAIRYEAEIDPRRVGLCHCTDCQTFGSSAFRIAVFVGSDAFTLLSGTPTLYEKMAESGNPRLMAFCSTCGTHVYGTTEGDDPKTYSLRVGTMAQASELRPVARVWCRSAPEWVDDLASLHRIETQ
jgi:hypothetical protein